MNTRRPLAPQPPVRVLSVSFGTDTSMFMAGFEDGFRVYETAKLQLRTKRQFGKGIGIAVLRNRSNFSVLVGGGRRPCAAQNRAHFWEDGLDKRATEIKTEAPIRGIRLSQQYVAVILQHSVSLYTWEQPPKQVSTFQTVDNLLGLCCVSDNYLAIPGQTVGHVQLVEVATGSVSIIPAHTTALRALALSKDGQLLATASDQGTLIRVFATHNTAKVAELRRGIDPAIIWSLAFSPSGALLACTSDKQTLHVFDIPGRSDQGNAGPSQHAKSVAGGSSATSSQSPGGDGQGKWGVLGKIPYMPKVFSDTYSFASADIDVGNEPHGGLPLTADAPLGTTKPMKGVLGWLDEETMVVLSAGLDARWEKFGLGVNEEGKRSCARVAWKRFAREV